MDALPKLDENAVTGQALDQSSTGFEYKHISGQQVIQTLIIRGPDFSQAAISYQHGIFKLNQGSVENYYGSSSSCSASQYFLFMTFGKIIHDLCSARNRLWEIMGYGIVIK